MNRNENADYHIQALTAADVAALCELDAQCFETPWSKAMFDGEFKNAAAHYYGIMHGRQLVAYLGVWFVCDEGQITNIAVHPSHRRQGLAGQLLAHVRQLAPNEGLTFLTLEAREHNAAAIALYQKHGFRLVGRRRGYYENKEDALLMTLPMTVHEGENKD